MSRVFLGVHYPGDVLIGQIIAVITGVVVLRA
jgi:membrane-associated phospholipid phosphatase